MAGARGRTALHLAATRGLAEITKVLLSHKADPNAQDAAGNTPLHMAAVCGSTAVTRVLLEAGASRTLRNKAGSTAYDDGTHKLKVLII